MLIRYLKKFITKKTKKLKKMLSSRFGVDYYLIKGDILLKEKDSSGAKAILKKGLKRFPRSVKINTKLADLATEEKDWQSAVDLWKKVYEFQKSIQSVRVFIQLAIAYRKIGC